MASASQEVPYRGHGRDNRPQVAQVHHGHGVHIVGLVLLGPVVAQPDLVLVVEPLLVVGTVAGVEDPLNEAGVHGPKVLIVRYTVGTLEVGHKNGTEQTHPVFEELIYLLGEYLPS